MPSSGPFTTSCPPVTWVAASIVVASNSSLGSGAVDHLVFPSPFGVPALACCVILFPLRTSALLTVGLPALLHLDLNGVATFRRCETRPGWASPLSRGGGVLPTGRA